MNDRLPTLSRQSWRLASLIANAASAYHWSPAKASMHLHGKITFTPNEGGKPFKCGVTMDFKTARNGGQITAVKFPHGDCEGVHFLDQFPWNVAILNAKTQVSWVVASLFPALKVVFRERSRFKSTVPGFGR